MNQDINFTSLFKTIALLLLLIWSFFIVKPFIALIAWGVIIAVALYDPYSNLMNKFKPSIRGKMSALLTLLVVLALLGPLWSFMSSVSGTTGEVAQMIKNDSLKVPAPSEKIKDISIIGEPIYQNWQELAQDSKHYVELHKDFIVEKSKALFASLGNVAMLVLLFLVSFIIAVVFMNNAESYREKTVELANKLIGDDGEKIVDISKNTIKSVVKGVILIALIQAVLSFIGFKLIGLPAAALFALAILVAGIVQLPILIVAIVPIALAFSMSDNMTYTIIFTVYTLIVALLDNFLKPVLLAKGLSTPTVIIFIGAIGGLLLHGVIGLFVGTVVLALVHQFYLYWMQK